VVLVTTLLDAQEFTKEEIADLILHGWKGEPDPRAIKNVLPMDVLRCKTPEMVQKEIWTHLHADNLIRSVLAEAAEAHDAVPRQLSFKGALKTITAFQDSLRFASAAQRARLWEEMLKAIASHHVGDRPGRVEPRANKRRPKKQRYLNEPRHAARNRLTRAG
jgi:hypothetical protein